MPPQEKRINIGITIGIVKNRHNHAIIMDITTTTIIIITTTIIITRSCFEARALRFFRFPAEPQRCELFSFRPPFFERTCVGAARFRRFHLWRNSMRHRRRSFPSLDGLELRREPT